MSKLINCVPPENIEEYKNVMVYVEHRNGSIVRGSLEMIGRARVIADKVNEKVICVSLGDNLSPIAEEAGTYGCDIFLGAESPEHRYFRSIPYAHKITDFIEKYKPNILLISGTREGRDLVSRIAVRVRTGVAADCVELDVEPKQRLLISWRPAFGDKTINQILCRKHRPQTVSSRPGSYPVPEKIPGRKCEVRIEKVKLDEKYLKHRIVSRKPKEKLDLTKSDIIVSGGLGLGKPDGFKLIRELADVLGGDVGASRPVVDLGWIPYDHQVGQTGQTVRAKLYVAAGISGKIQHVVGMKASETIISINNDPDAGIAKYSDYFINADLYKAIPIMIDEIKKRKKGSGGAKKSS